LGGDSFQVRLDAAAATVEEAKSEIARVQGTKAECQELYRVAIREDGGAVREDDAEPELLEDSQLVLEEGAVVAMAVKEPPLLWRTFQKDLVELSEGGAVATQVEDNKDEKYYSHVTSGTELTVGRHFWEMELHSEDVETIFVGVTRPNLDPEGDYTGRACTDGWFINNGSGTLCGNGKYCDDQAGSYEQGDRVGVLLDLNNGSLLFFKNGVQHGPGYPAGSVTGTVVAAVELGVKNDAARLYGDIAFPAGHVQ
jgi:hypothetical protein